MSDDPTEEGFRILARIILKKIMEKRAEEQSAIEQQNRSEAGGAWTDTVFSAADGNSLGPLIEDASGVLYGTKFLGGGGGTVFSITQ